MILLSLLNLHLDVFTFVMTYKMLMNAVKTYVLTPPNFEILTLNCKI